MTRAEMDVEKAGAGKQRPYKSEGSGQAE